LLAFVQFDSRQAAGIVFFVLAMIRHWKLSRVAHFRFDIVNAAR
jgi:hypothetical protein